MFVLFCRRRTSGPNEDIKSPKLSAADRSVQDRTDAASYCAKKVCLEMLRSPRVPVRNALKL